MFVVSASIASAEPIPSAPTSPMIDPRRRGVEPEEAHARAGERRGERREVERVDDGAVDVVEAQGGVPDDHERAEAHQRRPAGEAVETVGDVHGVGRRPDDQSGEDDEHPRRHVPARVVGAGERDRLGDAGLGDQPPRDQEAHPERDVVLLLPEDAPVVAFADLDEVVEEAHQSPSRGSRPT